jgi:hypothetical protein
MIEKTKRTGLIREIAERTAVHPSMEAAVVGAVRAALPGVIESVIAQMFPDTHGDTIRLSIYRRKKTREHRRARDERILAAISANEAVSTIAARESVSERHVFRVKAKALTVPAP